MKTLAVLAGLLLITACSSLQTPANFSSIGECHVEGCKSMSIHEHVVFP